MSRIYTLVYITSLALAAVREFGTAKLTAERATTLYELYNCFIHAPIYPVKIILLQFFFISTQIYIFHTRILISSSLLLLTI